MNFAVQLLKVAATEVIGAFCRKGVDYSFSRFNSGPDYRVWQNADGTIDDRGSAKEKAKHPTKKDGTLDMRYKINWGLKK